MGVDRVRGSLWCSLFPGGGLRRRLARGPAAAVCGVALALAVPCAPALGAAPAAAGAADEGGISGTVTAAAGGARLSGVNVEVFASLDSEGDIDGSAVTGADGSYTVTGLDPADNDYTVCFDASQAVGGSSRSGYLSQCYRDVPWTLGSDPPPDATPVPVTAGRLTPWVDAALCAASGTSGSVTAAAALPASRISVPDGERPRLPLPLPS